MSKRHSTFIDIAGQRFGRLVVVRPAGRTANSSLLWECRCDCGKTVVHQGSNLRSGAVRSCTCLKHELHVAKITKHGESRSKEHRAWYNIIARCHNPANPGYHNYGGRGIAVCPAWRESFDAFLASMGRAPSWQHSVERADNHGPYSPENCHWALPAEQAANKRNNHQITHAGLTLHIAEWARRSGMSQYALKARLLRGWSVADALSKPLRKHRRHSNGPANVAVHVVQVK